MKVWGFAVREHYAAHLRPILDALPPELVGGLVTDGSRPRRPGDVILLADVHQLNRVDAAHVVLVEHGAGQRYEGCDSAAYSGGSGRDKIDLFICPSETVAQRNLARYPDAQAVAVGNPSLDEWTSGRRGRPEPDLAVVTFHYDETHICPETRSALRHYAPGLRHAKDDLAAHGIRLAGHSHPRIRPEARRRFHNAGVPMIETYEEVLDRAALLAGDNTSALFEAASLGRPVVFLNAPHYRRGVHHGLRFWDAPQGQVSVDDCGGLATGVLAALDDPPATQHARRTMVANVYAACDGQAAQRAADAILTLIDAKVAA